MHDAEHTQAPKIADVAPFLSAPVVQALQAVMCGVGALQRVCGTPPPGVTTGGLLADVCGAVRLAVEQLYQASLRRCATPLPKHFVVA